MQERYYELTLQLAGVYATKYNRITAYTKDNISTSYSVQIGYKDAIINLWGVNSHIKIVTNWKVSIEPSCLNKLGKILGFSLKLSSKFGEYGALMNLLTQTGINLLDMIDLQEVSFSALLEVILTEMDCQGQDFELVDVFDNSSRISLTVYAYDDNTSDLEDSSRMNSIVPFQLAYAVSIHKAQGLEYDSVKVIIPQSNSEKITHGIFYTAITRAKKKLKIYWSAETMKEIVSGFATNESNGKSLEIVKAKLAVTQ